MSLRQLLVFEFFNKALFRNNGIARRIMLAVILFSTLVTTIITGLELYIDYRNDVRGIGARVELIRKVYSSVLTESVWVAEQTQIQNLLNGLLHLENIEYVAISSEGRILWSAGTRHSERFVEKAIPLVREHRGKDLTIAQLHVVGSIDNIINRLWSRLVNTLIGNGIKTFLVTAFVLLIFQALVGQHLEHISGHLRKFSKSIVDSPDLRLRRGQDGLWRPDALDHVTKAINQMRLETSRAHLELKSSNQQLHAIIDTSPLAIYTRDLNNRVTSWNPAAESMFGWSAAEAIGHPVRTVPDDKQDEHDLLVSRVLSGEAVSQLELVRQRRDGSPVEISLSVAPLRETNGDLYGYLTIAADITARKSAERQIQFLAYHDVLTRLPNRLLLQDRFEQAKAHADRTDHKLALLFLDLDNFKSINDTLGHDAGDALLKVVTTRLAECVRNTDTISRQGGDEFLILLSELSHADDAGPVLLKIMERLQEPILADGHEMNTSVSMGVAIYPEDGDQFETLLKKADMAMYQAKEAGRNTYRYFDEGMNAQAIEHLVIRNGLSRALSRDEFVLFFQPQIDLSNHRVTGVEALLRWNHPELGMVSPARFIPVAEESGLIVPIGEWVLHEACAQAMSWQRAGLPELTVAVNLSAVQFKRGNLEQSVLEALEKSGLKPDLLELELTESILIQNAESVLASVKRLKELGVKLSIDDFGTGYSSLSYLKRFAIDKLKIDQSFVRDLATDPDDAAIVRAIIQMARSLNLRTIAEGVENPEMLAQLRAFQCDEAQGYHFARPMPADELVTYLRREAARRS